MTYEAAVRYLMSLLGDIRAANFGLSRMQRLMEALGHPERSFRTVHIAGTNGKGSTAAFIESGLRAAGYHTGLYTSPHLVRFNERLKLDGRDSTDEEFSAAVAEVRAANERLLAEAGRQAHPTFFETVTATVFCGFRRANVDWGVVEVGLGGRLDATNVVTPEVAVITSIDFDHEAFLGIRAPAIAAEKAGIIKRGCKLIVSEQHPPAMEVILKRAEELGASVRRVGVDWRAEGISDCGGCFRFDAQPADERPSIPVKLSLAGEHQVGNALTAVAALDAIVIDASAINAGLASAEWPGRLQTIERDPEILLDAAHNPGGARVLARFLANHRAGRTIRLIYGASRDKAIDEVAGTLFPLAAEVYLTRSQVTRSVRPALLAEITDHHHANVHLTANLGEAIEAARAASGSGDVIVIAGSVFLVGEAIGLLRREPSLSVPG